MEKIGCFRHHGWCCLLSLIKNDAVLAIFYCGLQSVKSFHTALSNVPERCKGMNYFLILEILLATLAIIDIKFLSLSDSIVLN